MKRIASLLIILLVFAGCKTKPNRYVVLSVHFNSGIVDTLKVYERYRLAFECLEERPLLADEYNCVAREVKYVKRVEQ